MERIVGDLGPPPAARSRSTRCPTLGGHRRPRAVEMNQQFDLHIDEGTTRRSAASCWVSSAAPSTGRRRVVENRTMRVNALDGIRVAKVWLSKPASPPEEASAHRVTIIDAPVSATMAIQAWPGRPRRARRRGLEHDRDRQVRLNAERRPAQPERIGNQKQLSAISAMSAVSSAASLPAAPIAMPTSPRQEPARR